MATTPTPEELALHVTVEQALHLVNTLLPKSYKAVEFVDGTFKFWKTEDTSGTPDKEITIVDRYLDNLKSGIVANFAWSNETYPGSTNPNLDGKAVFVLAVKGENDTVTYSFGSLSAVVDSAIADKADKLAADEKLANQIMVDDGNGNLSGSGKTIDDVKNSVIGKSTDTKDANTVLGAKKYAEEYVKSSTATMTQFCNALGIPEPGSKR